MTTSPLEPLAVPEVVEPAGSPEPDAEPAPQDPAPADDPTEHDTPPTPS